MVSIWLVASGRRLTGTQWFKFYLQVLLETGGMVLQMLVVDVATETTYGIYGGHTWRVP